MCRTCLIKAIWIFIISKSTSFNIYYICTQRWRVSLDQCMYPITGHLCGNNANFFLSKTYSTPWGNGRFEAFPDWLLRLGNIWIHEWHYDIWINNYYPLFRIRSWNNGMRCISLCMSVCVCAHILFICTYTGCFEAVYAKGKPNISLNKIVER